MNASGDAKVQTSQSLEAVFVNSGDNPFELIKDSIKYVFVMFYNCPYYFTMLEVRTEDILHFHFISNFIGYWRNTKELSVILKTRRSLHILTGLDGALGMPFTLK